MYHGVLSIMKYSLLLAAFLLFPAFLAEDDTLEQALKNWDALEGVEFGVEILSSAMVDDEIRGRCYIRRDQARMELHYTKTDSRVLVVDDGHFIWTEMVTARISGRPHVDKSTKGLYGARRNNLLAMVTTEPGAPNPAEALKILGASYDLEDRGELVWLGLTVRCMEGEIKQGLKARKERGDILDLVRRGRILLDKDSLLPRGVELYHESPDNCSFIQYFFDYKMELSVEDSAFRYRPPADAIITDETEEFRKGFRLSKTVKKPAPSLSESAFFKAMPEGNVLELILYRDGSIQALDRNHKSIDAIRTLFRQVNDVSGVTPSGECDVDVAVYTGSGVPLGHLLRIMQVGSEEGIRIHRYLFAARDKKTKQAGFLSYDDNFDPGPKLNIVVLATGEGGPVYKLRDAADEGKERSFHKLADLERALEKLCEKDADVKIRLVLERVPLKGKIHAKVKTKHLIDLMTLLYGMGVELAP